MVGDLQLSSAVVNLRQVAVGFVEDSVAPSWDSLLGGGVVDARVSVVLVGGIEYELAFFEF